MKKTPSRINEEVKTLKLNVTNIRSIIIQKNKTKEKLKKKRESGEKKKKSFEKLKSEEKNLEKKKKIPVVSRAFSKVKDTGANILDKILNFGGLILAGILVNNLPKIIETVRDIIDSIVNFLTPIQSGFNLIKAFFTGEIDQSKYDADKKRVDDSLSQLSKEGGLIDQLAEKAGPLGGLIKLLKPAVEQIRNVMGGKRKVLAVKDGKEGVKDLDTGEFTERQFTQAERSKYIQSGGQGAGRTSSSETAEPSRNLGKNQTSAYQTAVNVGKLLNRKGYDVWQHPDFNVDSGYTGSGKERVMRRSYNSYHNYGEALDVPINQRDENGNIVYSPEKLDKLYSFLNTNRSKFNIAELKWKDDSNHFDHLHVSFKGGGETPIKDVGDIEGGDIEGMPVNIPDMGDIEGMPMNIPDMGANNGPNYKEEEKMLFDRFLKFTSNKLKDQQVSTISKPIDDEEEESSILVAVQRIYNTKSIPFPTYIPV